MEKETLDQIAASTYENFFTNRINDLEGILPGPDENIITEGLHWYREQIKEQWELNYIAHTNVEYQLFADYLAATEDRGLTLIGIHGFSSSANNVGGVVKIFWDANINILTPDMRGHGRSLDSARGLGTIETQDIISWVNEVINKKPNEKILLMGMSMGASIALQTVSRDDLPGNVIGVIEDCGFEDLQNVLMRSIAGHGLTDDENSYILSVIENTLVSRQGRRLNDGLSLDKLAQAKVPLFAISGTNDGMVPPELTSSIVSAYGGISKDMWIVDGAGHPTSISTQYANYKNNVLSFMDYLQGAPLLSGIVDHVIKLHDDVDLLFGVSAKDLIDGDLTTSITINGNVNTEFPGIYTVTYNVRNSQNIETSKSATYTVLHDLITQDNFYLAAELPQESIIWEKGDTLPLEFYAPYIHLEQVPAQSATASGFCIVSLFSTSSSFIDIGLPTNPITTIDHGQVLTVETTATVDHVDVGTYHMAIRANALGINEAAICKGVDQRPWIVEVTVVDNENAPPSI